MACDEALLVQALFDGELEATATLGVERHLEHCVECSSFYADLEASRNLLRASATYHRAGDRLRKSIVAGLGREQVAPNPRRWLVGERKFLAGLVSGIGAAAVAATLAVFLAGIPGPDLLVGDVVNAHLRSLMADHLTDVVSSDHHTVKPWFAGHTDVSPPANDFSKEGFRLLGGRADYLDGHRAAVVVYRHGLHTINVFAWAADKKRLPETATRNGYHLLFWKSGDLAMCAISDTDENELAQLVQLIKASQG